MKCSGGNGHGNGDGNGDGNEWRCGGVTRVGWK